MGAGSNATSTPTATSTATATPTGLNLLLSLLLAAPALPLAPCQLGDRDSAVRVAAQCGTFEVPEDHANPGGRRLALRVALVKAESSKAAPDPVFLLAGGPGQAATVGFPPVLAAFRRVGAQRDLVMVDQRGTGASAPLECPGLADAASVDRTEKVELEQVERCAASLAGKVDLRRYGSLDHARDLDLVRAALGYQKVNLIGASYGTRAALVYTRAFPERVRSLVLDGVAPMEMIIGGSFEDDGQRALSLAFRRCREDAECRGRFPDPEGDLRTLLAEAERRPRRLTVRDPVTGAPVALVLRADVLRRVALLLAYATETMALLPALLREARAGDAAPLAAQALLADRNIGRQVNRALHLAVVCAEDVPFLAPPTGEPSLFGTVERDGYRRACARWPHEPVGAAFHAPFRSSVPALLLSGEADPVTPPRWAELTARSLSRSRHLVLPGAAHGTLYRGCVPRLVAAFLDAGSADGLDASCVERSRPHPFFLDLAGLPP